MNESKPEPGAQKCQVCRVNQATHVLTLTFRGSGKSSFPLCPVCAAKVNTRTLLSSPTKETDHEPE